MGVSSRDRMFMKLCVRRGHMGRMQMDNASINTAALVVVGVQSVRGKMLEMKLGSFRGY